MSEDSTRTADLPYRSCVGMVLINHVGKVFVGRRIDQTLEAWQMPQGGVDEGEDPKTAALRELKEEIGTAHAEILREHNDWLTYDLPPHLIGRVWGGRYRGQTVKWFALRFLGADSEINLNSHDPEFSEWKWVGGNELLRLIVPFKRGVYEKAVAAFSDLIESD